MKQKAEQTVLGKVGRKVERQAKRFYCIIDSLRVSIIHQFNMVPMLYSASIQIRVSTRDLMKEKEMVQFVPHHKEWVVW